MKMKNLLIFCCLVFCTSLNAQTPVLGDTLRGGFIFHVNSTADTAFICTTRDVMEHGDWQEAKKFCENTFSIWNGTLYRTGWRMPTLEEVKIIRKNRDALNTLIVAKGGLRFSTDLAAYYWTSTEAGAPTHAWVVAFGFHLPAIQHKGTNTFRARAVQAVPLN